MQKEHHHNDLIINILSKIAHEKGKSLDKIKNLLLIKQNKGVVNRFWKIIDNTLPNHKYLYVGCCAECGSFELREEL